MRSELVVDVKQKDISIALLEESRLVSLQKESRDASFAVGNLYIAKVKKLMPGLNAAFVNVGYEKDAFLHYLDLGSQFNTYAQFIKSLLDDQKHIPNISKFKPLPDIDKHGTITDVLHDAQEVIVQIAKEPISTKGPRLTTEISFTGRFLVLIPFQRQDFDLAED
jgi:ribonuclease G